VTRLNKKIHRYEFSKLEIPGFGFIINGLVELQTPTNWMEKTLQPSDYFGENLLFNTIGLSRFGKLIAKTQLVECLIL